jgi:uncharacterized repeat protein (TIGR02543 family)
VSFTVTPAYRVSLSETGTYPFPGAAVGYGAQAARTVTIRNTGDAATGALTIASGNTNFVVSKTGITDLALNGTDTFTVVPKDGLAASSTPYTATITVGGGNIPSAGFDVSFTVAAASYGISLSAATFPEVYPGYEAAPVRSITVINEGNQATGALTIAKGGTNAASFTVSETTIAAPGIPGGESGSITVTPIDGLTAGTYTATVTVSGGANITSKNVAVSFTVKTPGNPFYEIGLGVTGTYTFPAAIEGYTTAPTRDVTITNEGNQATGALNIASGSGSSNFTVSPATITDVGISVSDSFTVAPNTMLSAGTYTETITVSGANITSKDFVVSFTVEPPTYIVGLSETGPYVFPDAFYGYTVGTALTRTVTITSTGNQATGALNIASDSANFEVSKTSIVAPGIGPNGAKESFTVTPAADLSIGGPYTATITVSGGDIASKSFDVSFTVTTAPVISLSDTGYVFPTATVGYGAQTPRTVTVTNAGDKETGRLMITKSGTNSGDFAVSKNSLNSIAVGETDSFTVVPNTRLSAKDTPYTATVTVGGEGIVPRTFDMSFTVNPYAVTFSAPGSVPATSTALARGANNTVALPQNPSRNGYTFDGWYTTGGSPFTATTRVTRDITVYARWKSANARLADLSVSQGVLLPAFNANTTAYSVEVPYATTSINVNATRADGKPYVQYPSGNPVSLNVGLNVITLKVIADDGTVIDYTIGVTRAQALSNNANLSSLGVSVGALSPVFSPDRTAYTVVVPKDTFNITINAAAADVKAESVVQSPGVLAALTALGSKPSIAIAITVTAEDGSVKAYTITVTKGEANNAVNVSIGITDEYIDLTGNNQNDLSRELNNSLRLKAPDGYTNYVWRVDGVVQASFNNLSTFELLDAGVLSLGTHSVLLEYKKDGTTYGCEVQFRVVR